LLDEFEDELDELLFDELDELLLDEFDELFPTGWSSGFGF
jgi:hypothetical protein